MALQAIWFILIVVLLAGYAVLDGYDLGAGFWYFFTKKDEERRSILNAIGPFWDGNMVWLLTGGGALFAAFPEVYATVFSGMYLALMLVLFALIFRAVAIEYRSKSNSKSWKSGWDLAFFLGSTLPALLYGVALGNILRGLPLDAHHSYMGNFFTLLNPFALFIGVTGLAMLLTHGALYISITSKDDLALKAVVWAKVTWIVYSACFCLAVAISSFQGHLDDNYRAHPALWFVPIFTLIFIVLIFTHLLKNKLTVAFIASSLSIIGVFASMAVALFPNIVPSLDEPGVNMTIYNSSSSQRTLLAMLIIALIGMPIVVWYTIWINRILRAANLKDDRVY
jgi:cytochrome bd ubiquinol oxidase subunit II